MTKAELISRVEIPADQDGRFATIKMKGLCRPLMESQGLQTEAAIHFTDMNHLCSLPVLIFFLFLSRQTPRSRLLSMLVVFRP